MAARRFVGAMASAPEKPLTIEHKLGLVKFEHDEEPFITVDTQLCATCADKPCLYVCPAKVYEWADNKLAYNTEGCIELGACAVVCQKIGRGAIRWSYPRGGYGVEFKFG